MMGLDRVVQRARLEIDMDHRLAGALHCLLDGDRHFTCLAITKADPAITIAHHGQRGETHLAATLDGLGYPIDGDELLKKAICTFAIIT